MVLQVNTNIPTNTIRKNLPGNVSAVNRTSPGIIQATGISEHVGGDTAHTAINRFQAETSGVDTQFDQNKRDIKSLMASRGSIQANNEYKQVLANSKDNNLISQDDYSSNIDQINNMNQSEKDRGIQTLQSHGLSNEQATQAMDDIINASSDEEAHNIASAAINNNRGNNQAGTGTTTAKLNQAGNSLNAAGQNLPVTPEFSQPGGANNAIGALTQKGQAPEQTAGSVVSGTV